MLLLDLHILGTNHCKLHHIYHLQKKLAGRKSIITIQNADQKCFLRSVIAGTILKYRIHNILAIKESYEDRFNVERMLFLRSVLDIMKFEK